MNDTIHLEYTIITTPLPDFIYEGLKDYSRNANAYRPQPKELIAKLATKHSLSENMIFLTEGADEAIRLFALAYGKETYIFPPTFISYGELGEFYANVHQVNALQDNNYAIDTSKKPDATLIYLVNPNNPFGITQTEKVIELIENNQQAIVVIDEVYAEFSDVSVIQEVKKYKNLAIIRSFSKAYGMAGNRIGYVVTSPEIIEKLITKTQWANVAALSTGAAQIVLDHEAYFIKMRDAIIAKRKTLVTFLTSQGFICLPSHINCVLLRLPSEEQAEKLVTHLKDNHIIVSHGNGHSNIGLDKTFIRIAIGGDDELAALQSALSSFPH